MTRPDLSKPSPTPGGRLSGGGRASPESTQPRAFEASGRRLAATLAGGVVGAIAFAVLILAGLLAYQRLSGGSVGFLAVFAIVFGAGGIYAGWIAATMVFAALRGGDAGPPPA